MNGQQENSETVTLIISPNIDSNSEIQKVAQAELDTGVENANGQNEIASTETVQKPVENAQPMSIQNEQSESQAVAQTTQPDPNVANSPKIEEVSEAVSKPESESQANEGWLFGLIDEKSLSMGIMTIFVGSVIVFGVLVACSMYYRVYMSRHRTPLFNAPNWLRMFFPKPVNYEHEITVLCAKYLDN